LTYIQTTLLKNETVQFETKPHWIVYGSAVGIFLVGCAAWWALAHFGLAYNDQHHLSIFMWIVWVVYAAAVVQWIRMWIFHSFSDFGVTNRRVIMKVGWISRDAYETYLERIEGTRVDQSILGRILGYGTLIVIGTGGTPDAFPYIPNVLQFRSEIQKSMDNANQKVVTQ
jgi:uncharacterized membrane protein YdbT with pleckstrin-like domain